MIKIQARSLTTNSKKWFLLSDNHYKNRFTFYPAWSFDENTKITNILEQK